MSAPIGLDPADDELARAQHQVLTLERELLAASTRLSEVRHEVEVLTDALSTERLVREGALTLRDESAREHERERTRRQEVEEALTAAYEVMNHMGDILNEMDAVEDGDLAFATPRWAKVEKALGIEHQEDGT